MHTYTRPDMEEIDLHVYHSKAATMSLDDISKHLHTDYVNGLHDDHYCIRIDSCGRNEWEEHDDENMILQYLGQFKEPMIILLLTSAFVSACIGSYMDAVSIVTAVIIVCTVAFVQELKSEQALEKLKNLTSNSCTVIRESVKCNIHVEDLVPGDIIEFHAGDRIPADARVFESFQCFVDEGILTGETEDVEKFTGSYLDTDNVDNEFFNNIVYQGTMCTRGSGKGIVFATRYKTELGKIHSQMKDIDDPETPLQESMGKLAWYLTIFSFVMIVFILIVGIFTGKSIIDMITMSISLAVAAIPEGLPVVVTVTLSFGMLRMSRKNVIHRKLPSVESLGAVDTICIDKTGTLTRNEMTANCIFTLADKDSYIHIAGNGYSNRKGIFTKKKLMNHEIGDDEVLDMSNKLPVYRWLFTIARICNNAYFKQDDIFGPIEVIGQSTEGALLTMVHKAEYEDVDKKWKIINRHPFSSETKFMAVHCEPIDHATSYEQVLLPGLDAPECHNQYFVKGAPEVVINMCTSYMNNNGDVIELNQTNQAIIQLVCETFAKKSMRILMLAHGTSMKDLTFIGIIGIIDPPRKDMHGIIHQFKHAGIRVVMMTGDNQRTATSIASKVGIPHYKTCAPNEIELRGEDIKDTHVFYRMTPESKMNMVRRLQGWGHIVGMIGDGVNDALALKQAHVGIAMGKSGTDVCRESADLILMDDNIGSVLDAIKEGKSIYNNIQNFLCYQVTTSIACMTMVILCMLLSKPFPMSAMQILWINIIMDGPPAQALGLEDADQVVMSQPPRNTTRFIMDARMLFDIFTNAMFMVMCTMGIYFFITENTSVIFTTFVLLQLLNVFNCRTRRSLLTINVFGNKILWYAVLGCLLGQLAILYIPPLWYVFGTRMLSFYEWGIVLGITSILIPLTEMKKIIINNQF